MHTADQKAQLRQAITERLASISPKARLAEGRSLSRRILSILKPSDRVTAYFPIKTEADIRPLLLELTKSNQTLYLPVFADNKMILRQCRSLDELTPGELNIPEPPPDAYTPQSEEIDIVLVPGRAFDRLGNRLGRGAGGYDRWIDMQQKHNAQTRFIGVCNECQLVNEVPVEEHDQRVDTVITAREMINCMSS